MKSPKAVNARFPIECSRSGGVYLTSSYRQTGVHAASPEVSGSYVTFLQCYDVYVQPGYTKLAERAGSVLQLNEELDVSTSLIVRKLEVLMTCRLRRPLIPSLLNKTRATRMLFGY